ncbi:MAG: hypothetical protein IE889_08510, partial [Campylobacterales bacterium]|nr:hypothetical protein [Campylobacterales bacterium]
EYLIGENYLTYIKYVPSVEMYDEMDYLAHSASNMATSYEDNLLRFSYTLDTNLTPVDGHQLYITFFDMGSFFSFKIDKIEQALPQDANRTVLLGNSASFELTATQQVPSPTTLASTAPQHAETPSQEGILGWMSQQLKTTKERLVTLLEDIKANQSPSSYLWLLLFSLLYGMIHALGPGHGKSLVAAYFLGNNRSVSKAFSVSALIGVVHTFSAFILTFVIYYVLNTYMGRYFSDIEAVTTKVSALIIILIALYLLYKRISKRPKAIPQTSKWSQVKPTPSHHQSCGCGACQTQSTDIGVILSAGIIPCPGTVTVFIFTLSLGVYMVGLMSAIFMSIGMSFIIFIAAYLSLKVREKSSPNERIRQILDYGSLIVIFGLGVLLFWAA